MVEEKQDFCECEKPEGDPNYSICFKCDKQLGEKYYELFPFMKDVDTSDPEVQKMDYNNFNVIEQ